MLLNTVPVETEVSIVWQNMYKLWHKSNISKLYQNKVTFFIINNFDHKMAFTFIVKFFFQCSSTKMFLLLHNYNLKKEFKHRTFLCYFVRRIIQ